MSTKDTGELENEHAWLSGLLDNPGWKVFSGVWGDMLSQCAVALRAKENSNRDFDAGLVSAYERLLGWPANRIKTIEKIIKDRETVAKQRQ